MEIKQISLKYGGFQEYKTVLFQTKKVSCKAAGFMFLCLTASPLTHHLMQVNPRSALSSLI